MISTQHSIRKWLFSPSISVVLFAMTLALLPFSSPLAAKIYTPSHVYSGIVYANQLVDKLLRSRNFSSNQIPISREVAAKPMHVYELHVSVIAELYNYALKNNRRPPPLPTSTPILYSPTDVYYLTEIVIRNLEELYKDDGGSIKFSIQKSEGKTPIDVYSVLFELYHKLNLLNGRSKISPSEVYAHIFRAKEDLQYTLRTVSKELDDLDEGKKRLLVTAIYGMHPDGSALASQEEGKTPAAVLAEALKIRDVLNVLRTRNKLPEIARPELGDYEGSIKPIDVFLQTQFIIAELNILKIPMGISSTTNSAKHVTGKSPSDVYQQMKHINYMLQRIIDVL